MATFLYPTCTLRPGSTVEDAESRADTMTHVHHVPYVVHRVGELFRLVPTPTETDPD